MTWWLDLRCGISYESRILEGFERDVVMDNLRLMVREVMDRNMF